MTAAKRMKGDNGARKTFRSLVWIRTPAQDTSLTILQASVLLLSQAAKGELGASWTVETSDILSPLFWTSLSPLFSTLISTSTSFRAPAMTVISSSLPPYIEWSLSCLHQEWVKWLSRVQACVQELLLWTAHQATCLRPNKPEVEMYFPLLKSPIPRTSWYAPKHENCSGPL